MPLSGVQTLYRSAEVRVKWGNGYAGLLQNVTISIDAGIRPMFEVGSDAKFFIPDRAFATLRASRLYAKDHEDFVATANFGALLTQDGFTMDLEEYTAPGTSLLFNVAPVRDCKFFIESYRAIAGVANVVVMEDISAQGEAPPAWANFGTAWAP